MRTVASLIIVLAIAATSVAFDPIEPPKEKTVTWTTNFVRNVRIPSVEFTNQTTIEDALSFLQLVHTMPQEYAIQIDGSSLGKDVLASSIEFSSKDISPLEALSVIADHVDAEIVIGRGVIKLRPRNDGAQQDEALKP